MKKAITFLTLLSVIFMSSCMALRSDNYWVKNGKKWNDHTNGNMKCRNNASPTGKFNK